MALITKEDFKNHARIDIDDDDDLIDGLIEAGEEYLKNATGKEYPETDEAGNEIKYPLEKIYLKLLLSYWYENRTAAGKVSDEFTYSTRSIMLQLKNR